MLTRQILYLQISPSFLKKIYRLQILSYSLFKDIFGILNIRATKASSISRFQAFSWSNHPLKFKIAQYDSEIAVQNENCCAKVLVQLCCRYFGNQKSTWTCEGQTKPRKASVIEIVTQNSFPHVLYLYYSCRNVRITDQSKKDNQCLCNYQIFISVG